MLLQRRRSGIFRSKRSQVAIARSRGRCPMSHEFRVSSSQASWILETYAYVSHQILIGDGSEADVRKTLRWRWA